MGRVGFIVLVIGILVGTNVRSRATSSNGPSIESSNPVSLAQWRLTATEQRTNAVAWLNYGRAALNDITAQMKRTGDLPGTNAYDEPLRALETGLLLDPTDFRLNDAIATAYDRRATRKPSEDDQTKHVDWEKAIEHYSLALSNAPFPYERALIKQNIDNIRASIEAEREVSRKIEALEKLSPSEQHAAIQIEAQRFFASEKNQKHLAEARKRVQQEPENTEALLDYADILITVEFTGLGNTNALGEAHAVLEKAIGLDEHNSRAYMLMGRCVDLRGEETNALVYYKQALKENPNSQFVRDRIKAIEGRASYKLQLEHPAESPGQQ